MSPAGGPRWPRSPRPTTMCCAPRPGRVSGGWPPSWPWRMREDGEALTAQATQSADVRAAYEHCEQVTRTQARNFSYGIRLLPAGKRRALSAVYAFARRVDDIGDGTLPPADKLAALADARSAVAALER